MRNENPVLINENQKLAIGIALAGLDKVLCSIESWADGREARSALYFETNDLPPSRREALRQRAHEARKLLLDARDRLGLKATEVRASCDVWSRCCGFRDTLTELDAKHLQGYGELPPESAEYMNDLAARLVSAIDRLAEEAKSYV